MAGETVAVVIELAGDPANAAVSADLDIDFPADLLDVAEPVRASCRVAPRLEATHQVGGRVPEPGLLRLALFARSLQIHPLGNGPIASCDVQISDDADATSAPLTPAFVGVGDSMGSLMPAAGVAGEIEIAAFSALPTEPPNQCLPGCAPHATPTATPAAPAPGYCAADCDRDGAVTVNELIISINVALGRAPLEACSAVDRNGDRAVLIGDLIDAVGGALDGCPSATD
jgi:hypothetical protein